MLVTQSCLTLCDPVDCILPGSSVHGLSQARTLEWEGIPFSRGSSWSGIKPGSLALQVHSLLSESSGTPPPCRVRYFQCYKAETCYHWGQAINLFLGKPNIDKRHSLPSKWVKGSAEGSLRLSLTQRLAHGCHELSSCLQHEFWASYKLWCSMAGRAARM